jgi:hypothetical protein
MPSFVFESLNIKWIRFRTRGTIGCERGEAGAHAAQDGPHWIEFPERNRFQLCRAFADPRGGRLRGIVETTYALRHISSVVHKRVQIRRERRDVPPLHVSCGCRRFASETKAAIQRNTGDRELDDAGEGDDGQPGLDAGRIGNSHDYLLFKLRTRVARRSLTSS